MHLMNNSIYQSHYELQHLSIHDELQQNKD